MRRTFQLQYNGEITRLINHDETAEDMQSALNQLNSIAPSEVVVSRSTEQVKTGPANGVGGVSMQVGGYVWYVAFASNTWKDSTEHHNIFLYLETGLVLLLLIVMHGNLVFLRLGIKMSETLIFLNALTLDCQQQTGFSQQGGAQPWN